MTPVETLKKKRAEIVSLYMFLFELSVENNIKSEKHKDKLGDFNRDKHLELEKLKALIDKYETAISILDYEANIE